MRVRVLGVAILVSLLVTAAASAQTRIGLGVKAGVNVATFSVPDVADSGLTSLVGPIVGVFFVVPVSGPLAVQPEVLYSRKGTKFTDGFDHLDYLAIPVLARISSRGATPVYALVGPEFAFKARATEGGTGETGTDVGEAVQSTDVGFAFGGGVEFRPFLVEARYTVGLRAVETDTSTGTGLKNRVFSIMAGIRF